MTPREKYDKDNPYIKMDEKVNVKRATLTWFGIPTIVAVLALGIPFFRHILTFGSFILAAIVAFGCYVAYEDKNNGVERKRPISDWEKPAWLNTAFFLFMIAITAGLRCGWYFGALAWLIHWVAFVSLQAHIRATYKD
jgi:hypothetical protein